MSQATDGELMGLVARGDRAAFADLVERHQRRLTAYLGRLCGSGDHAEELAQESFVRLFQAAAGYRDEGRLLPYLFRIGTNLLRTEERRRRRWQLLAPMVANGNGHGYGHAPGGGEESLLRAELQRRVRQELMRLPFRFRVPLVLFEVEEWSLAEIAGLLGCRQGTVKSRLHRGRVRLRRALTPYCQEGAADE
ncbi:MAG TPA: RNA polymerase sigma factor [Thermoanaerobaculia bacterium]|jgi:RNA polymerase sigma-70 factor (ECF subfamily)|nr:RNA polymerase sigma factor [Thermoanaerobaculia bacterium]